MAAGDAVDHRQAEAGALARLLGGEERLEDALERRRRPCRGRCRATERQTCGPGRSSPCVSANARSTTNASSRTSIRPGPPSIACQALVTRLTITWCTCEALAMTSGRSGAIACDELDPGRDERPQQPHRLDHHRPELDRPAARGVSGRLKVRIRCTSSVARRTAPPHLAEVLLHRMRALEVHRDQFEVAADRREQVVEVVGDAAGERAHRLHLLRLPQLRLESLAGLLGAAPLGDVDGRCRCSRRRRRRRRSAARRASTPSDTRRRRGGTGHPSRRAARVSKARRCIAAQHSPVVRVQETRPSRRAAARAARAR